ncbi:MAG: hypothetical protein KGN36_17060 [Acidobacteriota bacterium]|nr:hypothetical protein [Acidobacteriota bacterium]
MSVRMILDRVHKWEARRAADCSVDQEVRRHIALALEPVLGRGAVGRILPPPGETSSLLANAERALTLFLGAKAAATVVSRAMDQATVRI